MRPLLVRSIVFSFVLCCMSLSLVHGATELNKNFQFEPGSSLVFDGRHCSVDIEGGQGIGLQVLGKCRREIEQYYDISFEQRQDGLYITIKEIRGDVEKSYFFGLFKRLNGNQFGLNRKEQLKLTIRLPQRSNLDVTTRHGELDIRSVEGDVKAHNAHGHLNCSLITGNVHALNSHGHISCESITGDLEARTSHRGMTCNNIDGNVNLHNSHGGITCESVTGNLTVKTSHRDMSCQDIAGRVDARNSHGGIELTRIGGSLEARTSHDPISITHADSVSLLENSHGSIKVRSSKGSLTARTGHRDIMIEDWQGGIHAKNSHGGITVKMLSQPAGICRLATSHGNVVLSLPSQCNANVMAHASHGRISSDIPMSLIGEYGKDKLEGKLGDGGPDVNLIASHGNIRIKSYNKELSQQSAAVQTEN
jgi:DUF4097 and DUF4098 domain-containing protein YvlB